MVLQILASKKSCTFQAIKDSLADPPAPRTLRDDLAYLKSVHLIGSKGVGRGAKWFLVKNKDE